MYSRVQLVKNSGMEKSFMLQKISDRAQLEWKSLVRIAGSALLALSLGSSFVPTFAQQKGQRTFASAEEAGRALLEAMQTQDEQAPLKILGPDAKDVLSSGDPSEDADARVGFVVKYEEMHRFVTEPDGTVSLVIGAENWPFPIPLVNNRGTWYFDTDAGKDEILFRRIGENEIAAMEACTALVDAQKAYFARPTGALSKQFAQKLVSAEGRHDGLYWHGAYDEYASPINPLIANAAAHEQGSAPGFDSVPFHGYFFRILTSQGPHAPGGAQNYVVDGKMTGGFAFVAYPAEYRSSGVMTFIVDESGTIYEKDLGPNTRKVAEAINAYDPDSTWKHAEEAEQAEEAE
jgi:Protein of unknown function (DUF2950)